MKNLQIKNIFKPEKTGGLVNILPSVLENSELFWDLLSNFWMYNLPNKSIW